MHSQIPYSLPAELLSSYIFMFVFDLTSGDCHLSKLSQEKNSSKEYILISMFYYECICKHTHIYIFLLVEESESPVLGLSG